MLPGVQVKILFKELTEISPWYELDSAAQLKLSPATAQELSMHLPSSLILFLRYILMLSSHYRRSSNWKFTRNYTIKFCMHSLSLPAMR
jgi:hypothetical protein